MFFSVLTDTPGRLVAVGRFDSWKRHMATAYDIDHLAEADPGVVALGDDVELVVGDGDLERHGRMGSAEGCQQRA